VFYNDKVIYSVKKKHIY